MIEPAHEAVPRAAHLRAFEGVAAGRVRAEDQRGLTPATFRNDHVRVGTDDAEPMVRVVALQAELDHRSAFHLDLGRREREPLGGHPHHLAILRGARRRGEHDEKHGDSERAAADEPVVVHQNHHPSPMFRLSTLLNSELRFRITE